MRLLRIVPRVAAAVVVGFGAAALIGWIADVPWLRSPVAGFVSMVPNVALMLILSGLSLGLSVLPSPSRCWSANVLAAVSLAFALTTLAEDIVGRALGVDTLLFDVQPSRPPLPTTLAIALSDVALLVLDFRPRRGLAPAELLALAAATVTWLGLGSSPHASETAIQSGVAVLALALGIATARPESGAAAIFTSPYLGGQVARRMLLVVLAIPALGYFADLAQGAGLFQAPGAALVDDVAGTLVAIAITVAVGQSLERTDTQRRLIDAESREWKRFFDQASFGAAVGTPDARFGLVNEAFASMHGQTVAELEGRPVAEVFPPYARGEIAEKTRLIDEQGHYRWRSVHVRKDGTTFPVLIEVWAVRDEQGTVLYRAAYVQDITSEKEAESAQAYLASLVESAEDAIVAKALDGRVLAWNRGAERVYGYSAREMLGRSITAIVPVDRLAERDSLRRRVLAGETVIGVETERVRKDGHRLPVALTMSPIRDRSGVVVGVSSIARDISTLKQLERERQEWASVVAHDLRQPAAAIRMAVDILSRSEAEPTRQKVLDRACRASVRLERMIEDLLTVTRVGAGRLTVKKEPTDLQPLIAEAFDLTPELADRLRLAIAPDAGSASVDGGRFVQVLSNLLSNAGKYADPGTPIDVSVEKVEGQLLVTVTNEGPGIAPDELPRLFFRFARTRSAESGGVPGLGLGLYISRGIVEAHGGKLWAESAPGEKTRFRFRLPQASVGAQECNADPPPQAAVTP